MMRWFLILITSLILFAHAGLIMAEEKKTKEQPSEAEAVITDEDKEIMEIAEMLAMMEILENMEFIEEIDLFMEGSTDEKED